ncbi:MAG TPA: N-acetylmuramoyl-L-alanine amidase [Thermoanaerobaculia bacterium]|nr:N-acetylmuramoyl-L-alanine amidase [Thermoanaerobaculia bacterium]
MQANDFQVVESARALGFDIAADVNTGVLTLTVAGHQVVIGAGTTQVPVDQRILAISRPARIVSGALYAPPDFLEKVLFPLVGATGAYDAARKTWVLAEGTAPITLDVAVVHVEPTTQIVIRQSGAARFVPTVTETGFQVAWPGQKIVPPFPERRYDDPLVSAIRFSGGVASIEFREKGSTARAYPLSSPDRVVVEIGRPASSRPPIVAAPAPEPPARPTLTIVIDPGHGGTETGAVGPGGTQEKDVTLAIAKRLAATLPKAFPCRAILTRDSDVAIPLDDRTGLANRERADLFLSIHANSSRTAGARGSETYYLSLEASDKLSQEVASQENQQGASVGATPAAGSAPERNPDLDFVLWDLAQSAHLKESSELAESIQQELNALSGTGNRGIKQAPFRVLVGATMPAVLVETAFISNPEEEKKLGTPAFEQSVADAVSRAAAKFFEKRKGGPPATPSPGPTAAATPPARTP